MDKYTVDLDKVLNDFEYSEYSLESAKSSRNVQEDVPNSSYSSSYSNKNDTSVKHSINNVFHSLNEYLTSDITPKKVENIQPAIKNNLTKDFTLPSYSENTQLFLPQVTNFPQFYEKLQETPSIQPTDLVSEVYSFKPLDNSSNVIPDFSHSITENSIIDKTDTIHNTHVSQELPANILNECTDTTQSVQINNTDNIGESNLKTVQLDKTPQIENPEELLVDIDSTVENCDKDIINITNGETVLEDNESKHQQEIPPQIPILNSQPCDDEKPSIEENPELTPAKIGFENDFTLDEENLDEYFQELEREFGHEIQIVPNPQCAIEDTPENNQNIEADLTESQTNEVKPEMETTLKSKIDGDSTEQEIVESKQPDTIEEKVLEINAISPLPEKESEPIVGTTESNNEEKNTESSQTTDETEQKNSRPQHLPFSEDNQDSTRKINLIGDPGSTPYNNVYIAKDLEKSSVEEHPKEQTIARASSPTYSDVSTDSVSSSTSDDAEYNDAVSEINAKTEVTEVQNISDVKETVQNNMISQGETCRNDVTTDKDFKNNLKTAHHKESECNNVQNEEIEESCNKNEVIPEPSEQGTSSQSGPSVIVENEEAIVNEPARTEESTSLGIDWLGKQAPLWIPDNEATSCLHCDMKFTVIKRRHHCRACGLVLCSKCCNLKYRLEYLDAEARVCKKCYDILNKDTNSSSGSEISQESSSPLRNSSNTQAAPNLGQPNPNNPLEYCSTIPPMLQVESGAAAAAPSVMVPVGVLKRKGSSKNRGNKSVMFCDGIRPGSDLTNLDTDFNYTDSQKLEKAKKTAEKPSKCGKHNDMLDGNTKSFIPSDEKCLPPTVTIFKTDVKYSPCANNSSVVEMLRNETLIFALQSNVYVHVKIINMDCCVTQMAWCFSTEGLINVGQDEIVILLELIENEPSVPKDVFVHLNNIYLEAVKGSSVKELGLSLHATSPFLGSKNHAGFVYIRPTFQCLQNVIIPKEPYLIGILIHRWETPWAKLFPLRLILRLGAAYKYYPSPIISTRDRDSVFVEVGHTIINLLADFRNFSYTLPQIRGLTIHMEEKNTTVTIPVNRYDQVLKGLCNSSDHILAFAGNFSTSVDSHLVCIQDTHSATNNYSTHAINICNQPRKITGASFIVFNGALKSTSGLTAKSNIVEDGLMIQILPEHMLQVRESLKNMKDHTIKCGCVNEESDETVTIVWGGPDTSFNVGVQSPIDNKSMTGVPSIRVHNGKDYTCNSGSRLIRWTEVFIIQSGEESSRNQEPVDVSKISENIAKATCQALVKYLDLLVSNSFYKIGLRANLHVENVSYSAGSNNVKLPPIYMKSLDNELIPVLHRITSNNITEQPIILELIFRILNI